MATAVDLAEQRPAANGSTPVGKLASQVAGRIEADIVRRGWPVGESLGSELDLREQYRVSRAVLREAVRLVEHHQVARMRRGPNGGLLVVAPDAGPATRAAVIYLEYLGTSVDDLLYARLLIEPLAVKLATERITEDGITLLRRTLDAEREHAEPDMWSHDPMHVVLGELSGNPVLRLFIDVLTRLTVRYAHLILRMPAAEISAAINQSHRSHAAIVAPIIAGDAARAQTRMSDYLEAVAAWLREQQARYASTAGSGEGSRVAAGDNGAKLAEVVAAQIHADIAERGWPVGAVLGSEADLLARYGISRAVLREAVRLLEYHAVARMRRGPGGGLVVARPEPQASIDTMALYLEYQGVTGEDLQVVREAIELGSVARVAARVAAHSDPDPDGSALSSPAPGSPAPGSPAPGGDPEIARRLDAAARWASQAPSDDITKADIFHTELAELAGNPVLVLFLRIITELFRRHTTSHDTLPPAAEIADQVDQAHQRILAAILDGDEGVARHRMRRHLEALAPWWG